MLEYIKKNIRCVNKGFTLLELMVILSIFSIMATIGLIAFKEFIPKYRLKSIAAMVKADLNRAKTMATKLNNRFTVIFNEQNENNFYEIQESDTHNVVFERKLCDTNTKDVVLSTPTNPIFFPNGTIGNISTISLTGASDKLDITMTITGRIKID